MYNDFCKFQVVPDLHQYSKGQRFHVQPSRKVGCGAQIVVRHVSVFTDRQYWAQDIPVRSKKRQNILQDILNRIQNESPQYTGEEKIYICLPLCAAHSKHTVNPKIGLGNRINDGVKCKISSPLLVYTRAWIRHKARMTKEGSVKIFNFITIRVLCYLGVAM